jgi:alpha-tubulin suppressor-like RCC1 family protein
MMKQEAVALGGGTLWFWGDGSLGRNPNSSTANESSPIQIGSDDYWLEAGISGVGGYALKNDGTLYTWGRAAESGHNDSVDRSSPVQLGALTDWGGSSKFNFGHSCIHVVKDDGTLWFWGGQPQGQAGIGNTTFQSSPVQVGALTDWDFVVRGWNDSAAIKTDGTLWCWGHNGMGASGHGDITQRSSPVQVGALTNWAYVCGGLNNTYAIKTDGTLWSWGNNDDGQLGHGNTTNLSSPVQVGTLTNWAHISGGYDEAFAVKTDGTLWVWGHNASSNLGLNNTTNYSSPVQVGSLTDWKYVYAMSGGTGGAGALKTDGTYWGWGRNDKGQIGDGTTTTRSSPVQVGVLTDWGSMRDAESSWPFHGSQHHTYQVKYSA